jgi:hypothetical protein
MKGENGRNSNCGNDMKRRRRKDIEDTKCNRNKRGND